MIIVLKGARNKMCVVRVQNIAAQGQETKQKTKLSHEKSHGRVVSPSPEAISVLTCNCLCNNMLFSLFF